MNEEGIFRTYNLDYIGKYHFYEEDDFIKTKEDGEFILSKLKESNRFDYNGASFTFTKFGNISEGRTEREVKVKVEEDNINVKFGEDIVHLDLIYKMDTKRLEDHIRITTRISEKGDSVSCLLYVKLKDGEDFIMALESVKKKQIEFSKEK